MADDKIDPRAFVGQTFLPEQLSQGLVSDRKAQPTQPAQKAAPKANRPSQGSVNALEQRFAQALDFAKGGGFGALGGGISALRLAPKVRRAQEQANAAQVKAEDLRLEGQMLQNEKMRQALDKAKQQVMRARGVEALGRLETDTSENVREDVALAGGELNPNGTVKTNLDKVRELYQSSENPIKFDIERIAKFSPGLILRMKQKYSALTADQLINDLNSAGERERRYQETLVQLKKAKVSKSGDAFKSQRENFKAYSSAIASLGRVMEDIKNSDLSLINPAAINEITRDVLVPGFKAVQSFGQKSGVVKPGSEFSSTEGINAINKAIEGDGEPLGAFLQKMEKSAIEAQKKASVPENAPSNVKAKKKPIVVGNTESPPATRGLAGLLETANREKRK